MNKPITLIFILTLILSGCGTDIETITIQRNESFSFNIEGDNEIWRSKSFHFYPGQSIVKEFTEESEADVTVLLRRYYLVFEGTSPHGEDFELSVTLDIGDELDMRHLYSTEYDRRKGGLHQISMILFEKSGGEAVYTMAKLCPETADGSYFEIERQNPDEQLIAGSLEAELCFEDPSRDQLRIFNAQFKDIEY